jgi:hypothetical protein
MSDHPSFGDADTSRIAWSRVLSVAADIVRSYETGVTLRQLFYRLVAEGYLPNTSSAYKSLSKTTAAARRRGSFPNLIDRTRTIYRYETFTGADGARVWLADIYRRDRTEGQDVSLYLGVEKHGLVELARTWFGDLGVPIVALGGYSSQTYVDEIASDVAQQGRSAVLLYAGDFDPSGEDIPRDLVARTGCFGEVVRVALAAEQVQTYDLLPFPGKATDSRARAFRERYGQLVQVEVDALPPDVLKGLFQAAINRFWDVPTYECVLAREAEERRALRRTA